MLGLLTPEGKLGWRPQPKSLWGLAFNPYNFNSNLDPNLLFAGQYYDEESGLAYNRFRYYDPETACYLNSDPIGLAGGEMPYGYVHNPMDWVDLFGLSSCFIKEYDVVPYRPSSSPLENHHGVLDIWMSKNIPSYGGVRPRNSPTIALSKKNHSATKKVYRDWLEQKTGKRVGGKIDWENVTPREISTLTEKMFDSAKVPLESRNNYYRALNQYLYR